MAKRQFNLRLDGATADALKLLARSTQRSQAGVIRWLVLTNAANMASGAVAPKATNLEVTNMTAK